MVPTKWVYEHLHADALERHPDIDGMVEALGQGDLKRITQHMENVMETVTEAHLSDHHRHQKMMCGNGAMNALMSGSGPSIFGVFLEEGGSARGGSVH